MNYTDYMPKTTSRVRENIEWSISYSYNATETELPRVLLIGDSICNGYNTEVKKRLENKMNVTFWASSKCVTDKDYFRELDFILSGYSYDHICFNNGLHSLLTDTDEWQSAYRLVLKFIQDKCPDAKLSLVLCTPANDTKMTVRICELNDIIKEIASEFSLPVIDLFTPMDVENKNETMGDLLHFRGPAIEEQADIISAHITESANH